MKDIQGLRDYRRIAIRKVGVKHISYPITVLDRAHRLQRTVWRNPHPVGEFRGRKNELHEKSP